MVASADRVWIAGTVAAAILGVSYKSFLKIYEPAGIRRRVLPGAWTKFHLGDVTALAEASVVGGARERRAEEVAS
jgi:hypothetical protein